MARVIAPAAALACVLLPGIAAAHHSFAMFDVTRTVQIEGTVKEFQWTNPHVFLEVDVADKTGPKHYAIESGPIATLKAAGFKRTSLKPGDKAKMVIYPLRDGRAGGMLYQVTLATGETLTAGTGTEKPASKQKP